MGLEEIRKLKEQAGLPKEKKNYRIPKKSAKKIEQEKKERERLGGDDTDLVKWFKARMKNLTGRCAECGLPTETKIYQYAILSICHILAKRETMCPSVKYHPLNWVELCQHHHDKLDKSNWEEIEKWGCWPIIKERLIMVFPDLDPSEYRHFPESVMKFINDNQPF